MRGWDPRAALVALALMTGALAMALQGQGGPKDLGSGAGWLQAAAGNGCRELFGSSLSGFTAKFSPEEERAAAATSP